MALSWLLVARDSTDEEEELAYVKELIAIIAPTRQQMLDAVNIASSFQTGSGVSPSVRSEKLGQAGPAVADSGDLISTIQGGLAELGFFEGDADGRLDSKTVAAIEAFERDWDFDVTGRPTAQLSMMIGAALMLKLTEAELEATVGREKGSGSGFFVTPSGYMLTNEHVVSGCESLSLEDGTDLDLVVAEEASDLALLRAPQTSARGHFLKLRSGRGLRLGESVLVAGYPLSGILTSSINVTQGGVTALSGPGQNRGLFQLSAPVQPGNSGGPVLDDAGRLVGVVVSKLNALSVAEETGDIPQNINFAISLGTTQSFLDAHGVDYQTLLQAADLSSEEIAETARVATARIICR